MDWNHNLIVTYLFRVTFSITQGLWNSGVGSNYIYYLEHRRNTLVGLVQGIQGIFIPLASLPGGYIADRYRRDVMLRVFGLTGFVAIALSTAAVLAPKQPIEFLPVDIKYALLCAGYAFWGITQAANPIVESILADSVPTGGRSAIYTSLFFLGMLGRSIGPLIAALIFYIDGNAWKVSTLGLALMVGMLASTLPVSTLFFFNDNRSLGSESEAHGRHSTRDDRAETKLQDSQPAGPGQAKAARLHSFGLGPGAIPYFLSVSDLIYGLASGCTIKFFPIFFAKEVQLAPVAVNILMAAQPLAIGIFATLGQRLSVFIGRVQVLLLLRLLGFSLMGIMGLFPSLWSRTAIIVTIFLIRTGVNNAGYPIQKAVLMDYVPKKSRGKWSAIDSLTAFGWSGSAFLGGILVDHAGFDWCFLITAMAQCLGWAVLIPLLAVVPRNESSSEASQHAHLEEPLLAPSPETEEPGLPRESADAQACQPQQAETSACTFTPPTQGGQGGPDSSCSRMHGDTEIPDDKKEDEEFVAMIGTLKSPRRSMDEWTHQ